MTREITITIPAREVTIEMPTDMASFAKAIEAHHQGKKVKAIKITREITGYGLKESKEFMDYMDSEDGKVILRQIKSENPEYFL